VRTRPESGNGRWLRAPRIIVSRFVRIYANVLGSIGNNLASVIFDVILPRLNEASASPETARGGFGADAAGWRGGCVRTVRHINVVLVR
jgi:hypothetical protein